MATSAPAGTDVPLQIIERAMKMWGGEDSLAGYYAAAIAGLRDARATGLRSWAMTLEDSDAALCLAALVEWKAGVLPRQKVVEAFVRYFWGSADKGYLPRNIFAYVASDCQDLCDDNILELLTAVAEKLPDVKRLAPLWADNGYCADHFLSLAALLLATGRFDDKLALLSMAARAKPDRLRSLWAGLTETLDLYTLSDRELAQVVRLGMQAGGSPFVIRTLRLDRLKPADRAVIDMFVAGELIDNKRYGAARQALSAANIIRDGKTAWRDRLSALVDLREFGAGFARLPFSRKWDQAGAYVALLARYEAVGGDPDLEARAALAALSVARNQPVARFDPLDGVVPRSPFARALALSLVEQAALPEDRVAAQAHYRLCKNATAATLMAMADRFHASGRGVAALTALEMAGAVIEIGRFPAYALNSYFSAVMIDGGARAPAYPGDGDRLHRAELKNVKWPVSDKGLPWPYCRQGVPTTTGRTDRSEAPPRISVVIPLVGAAASVEETLLSVLNQGYPAVQIILLHAGAADGAADVLERYRDRLEHVAVEPGKGRAHAINTGMALADGDILHWLNADEMLCPGALDAVAREWTGSQADIIAGLCMEVSDRRVMRLTRPPARGIDLPSSERAEFFGRWTKDEYFDRPIAFFSRRIWEAAGGCVREDIAHGMDFDLWVRAADNGARYRATNLPLALFCDPVEQDADERLARIDAESALMSAHGFNKPDESRVRAVAGLIRTSLDGQGRVALVSRQYGTLFASGTAAEMGDAARGWRIDFYPDPDDVPIPDVDLIIHLCHAPGDGEDVASYRRRGYAGAVVGWFWDNHRHYLRNAETACRVDVVIPAHALFMEYLKNDKAIVLDAVPLCTTQWTPHQARRLYERFGGRNRSDLLYGRFLKPDVAAGSQTSVEDILSQSVETALQIHDARDPAGGSGPTPVERFQEWARYKTSLCLPVRNDLPQRFFDAWLTGQVPVAPAALRPALSGIDPAFVEENAAFFDSYDVADIEAAAAHARALFDNGGEAAMKARHIEAVSRQMLPHRIKTIIDLLETRTLGPDAVGRSPVA